MLRMFAKARVRICGEIPLRIHHCLLGTGSRSDVQRIYSKPQALSQCRNWIAKHVPQAELIELASTSEAARRAKEKAGSAAVASYEAGVHHQLDVLAKSIEDNPNNLTRFAVLSDRSAERSGDDKTSLMFQIEDRSGALVESLGIFKRKGLNMTWIESFPIAGTAGSYRFFVEVVGHHNDLRLRRAIEMLEKKTVRVETLGSYPRRDPIG